MIHVYLVAAYASVRAGLAALLSEAGDIRVIGQASGIADWECPLAETDVVLLDLRLEDAAQAVETLRETAARWVLLGDVLAEPAFLRNSLAQGGGWLRKEATAEEIIVAIRAAATGLIILDPAYLPWMTGQMTAQPIGAPADDEALTPRERDVLQLMAQGLPNKQIAARLSISTHTAKFHVASVLAKLGAASRTEAVTHGVRRGYVLL
jgi:DNA-binding NarL/FixJ family response regulator